MENNCPTTKEAMKIWLEGIRFRTENYAFSNKDEYIFHTQGVAFHSRLLAAHIPDLDPEIAYICGLLHDYGKKYNERETKIFHGLVGYQELSAMGWSLPAKICLSHTFPEKEFCVADFPSYRKEDLLRAKQILSDITYDDYDIIVQFVDKLFEGVSIVTYDNRAKEIARRYNLSEDNVTELIKSGDVLKQYLDMRCGQDVFKILGLS